MNLSALLKILQEATSSNLSSVANATKVLQESEVKKGYHYALLKIALSNPQPADLNIRWLAVLCLKNGVERHWRTHGPSPLEEDEKASIRNEILTSVAETVQQVLYQLMMIKHVCRISFLAWCILEYLNNKIKNQCVVNLMPML